MWKVRLFLSNYLIVNRIFFFRYFILAGHFFLCPDIKKFLRGYFGKNAPRKVKYYIAANRAVMEWFAVLRQKSLSKKEKKIGLILATMTPLLDDLTDRNGITIPSIHINFEQENENIAILTNLLKELRLLHPRKNELDTLLSDCLSAQNQSNLQKSTKNLEKIQEFTQKKGGSALYLYIAHLFHTDEVKQVSYNLGFCVQLFNDIFDMQSDKKNHINTLANMLELDDLLRIYKEKISACIASVYEIRAIPFKPAMRFVMLITLHLSAAEIYLKNYSNYNESLRTLAKMIDYSLNSEYYK